MKILIIPSWYPEGNDSLLGIYHKEYAHQLSKYVDVDMLYIYRFGIRKIFSYIFSKKKEIEKEGGYNVYKLKMLDKEKLSYDLEMKSYTKKLDKLLKEYIKKNGKPDILHAQVTIPAGYATTVLGKKYNIPVIVTEHSSNFMSYFEDKNEKYGKYVLSNAKFSTVSNLMKNQVKDLSTNCEIIPNLVDTTAFNVKRNKKIEGLNIGTISAFRVGKGIQDVIEAISILKDKKIDIHLNIIGDGYNRIVYENKAKELNISKNVTFHGRKTKEEIVNILSNCNLFVIGSHYESFCIPGVEALSCSLPIVSTKCYGPEEYLDDKTGALCNIKDAKDMADKIEYVYNNIDKYDPNYLRSVANRYSEKEVCKKAINIYKEMLKQSK